MYLPDLPLVIFQC